MKGLKIKYFLSRKLFCLFFIALFFLFPMQSGATKADELRQKIDERNQIIKQLETEIATYKDQVGVVSKQAKTLENALALLNTEIKKLEKEISLTQNKITGTNLTINKLADDIEVQEGKIDGTSNSLAHSIREMSTLDSNSLAEMLLSNKTLSDFWNGLGNLEQFQASVWQKINELKDTKLGLEKNKKEIENKKKSLLGYQSELADQKKIIEFNKNDKKNLLIETKSKESEYQKILDQKIAAKSAFERELFDFESQLKVIIDPKNIPTGKPGILAWPLDSVYITQLFGETSASHRLYTEGTHNGIDLSASVGTAVKSAKDGVVLGIGNTDAVKGCLSYGKWIMIDHGNGLSTLYGHLSLQKVEAGERISAGQVIGYSGSTGYATGPHLHFGVYATQGVRLVSNPQSIRCKGVIIPSAPANAYLNPVEYLPGA